MNKEFLEILCCPKRTCRGDLEIKNETSLTCKICKDEYPVQNGIPILFPNAKYSPFIHVRHWDKQENAESYTKKYDSYLKKQGSPWGLYTHESELQVIKNLTRNIDLKDKTILDCGSGNGRLLSVYPEARIKIGIDTSLSLLIANKKREPDFWLVCGQLEDMPFKDAVADFSISIRVYQHLLAPEEAFSEMVRVTKPSGHVSLELYNKLNLKEVYKHIRMLPSLNKRWPWGLNYDRYFSYREINKWSEQNFIKPIQFAGAGWGVHFYLFETLRFRHFAPAWLQRIVCGFFLKLDKWLGDKPVFGKTMEKICFIGSMRAPAKKSLWKKIKTKLIARNDKKNARKFEKVFENRNYALVGNDLHHLKLTIDWLKRAQDKTADGGVSRGQSLIRGDKSNNAGWQSSYPETTGYIIPSLIAASKILGDQDLINRSIKMVDWECNIMFPDGAVHGGNIASKENKNVFDTGQVLRGLLSAYKETKNEKYLVYAKKSLNWMMNPTGRADIDRAFYTYAWAPLSEWGVLLNDETLKNFARTKAQKIIGTQKSNGWIPGADFKDAPDSLLHTIAYTIDGLWDIGELLKEDKFKKAAQKALDGIISKMEHSGFMPGRYNPDFKGTVPWACLTGIAQIGVTCLKVYKSTGQKSYLDCADRAKEFLKTRQNNIDGKILKGAIFGSSPISGDYNPFETLNWPVKYFLDLLIEFHNLKK